MFDILPIFTAWGISGPLQNSRAIRPSRAAAEDVRRRYSKGRVFDTVLRKGYKKSGICACVSNSLFHLGFTI